jgi:hypothetical protein
MLDHLLCHLPADAKTPCQPESAHAIYDAEIDGFGLPAHFGSHFMLWDIVHLRCGLPMNISIGVKSIQKTLILTEVSKDAQFNLRVIGREK